MIRAVPSVGVAFRKVRAPQLLQATKQGQRRFARSVFSLGLGHQSIVAEAVEQRVAKRFAELFQGLGWQLLGEQFNDERCRRRGAHAALRRRSAGSIGKPSASRDSTYACATIRDNVRMRPIYAARS